MYRSKLALAVLGLVLLLTASVFIACGGNGFSIPVSPSDVNEQGAVQQLQSEQELLQPVVTSEEAGNRVILDVPAIDDLGEGQEFSAVISLDLVDSVHQGVLRVLYDSQSMTPVEISPGAMFQPDMVRIAELDNSGFLPLAFTALPGGRDIQPGQGELFRIRFRLKQPGSMAGRISFRSDREFLQLRDQAGHHLGFDVQTSAGGRDAH